KEIKFMLEQCSEIMNMSENDVTKYLDSMSDEELNQLFTESISKAYEEQYAQNVSAQLSMMNQEQLIQALNMALDTFSEEQCAKYYDEVLEFSKSNYEDNLTKLGYADLDKPSTINLYSSTFADKEAVKKAIDDYNDQADELSGISYTDYVGLIMSSVTTIIDAITYILIAFIAVSLIVSSIMIGVITLISVQERTKEIGILRAIGASKRNVSSMFNAETVIIGFISGLLGIIITYILCIFINIILHNVTGIQTLNANLPLPIAITLIIISVLLTLLAGIIPSRSAAKKDPVVALRTE
ncbi:MAG: FtsX-like permease family protein, partial [Clostridia bacterium]|nr:FtsX-like permease family protein [Clostridia bacterium]